MGQTPALIRDRAFVVLETRDEARDAFRLATEHAGPEVTAVDVVCLWHFPLRPDWNGVHRGLARDLMHDCGLFPVDGPRPGASDETPDPGASLTDELFEPGIEDLCHGRTATGALVRLLHPAANTLAGVFRSLGGNKFYSLVVVGSEGVSAMAAQTWRKRVKCPVVFTGAPLEDAS